MPDSVRIAYERCGAEDKTYREFGREHGDAADYGHGDIVMAESASREVFPFVRDFLAARADRIVGKEAGQGA